MAVSITINKLRREDEQCLDDCCNCIQCVVMTSILAFLCYTFIGLPVIYWNDMNQYVIGGIPFYAWFFGLLGTIVIMFVCMGFYTKFESYKFWIFTATLLCFFGWCVYGFVISMTSNISIIQTIGITAFVISLVIVICVGAFVRDINTTNATDASIDCGKKLPVSIV